MEIGQLENCVISAISEWKKMEDPSSDYHDLRHLEWMIMDATKLHVGISPSGFETALSKSLGNWQKQFLPDYDYEEMRSLEEEINYNVRLKQKEIAVREAQRHAS